MPKFAMNQSAYEQLEVLYVGIQTAQSNLRQHNYERAEGLLSELQEAIEKLIDNPSITE